MKLIRLLRLLPYLIKRCLRRIRQRRPSEGFYLLELTGESVMIWTPNGNVLLSQKASRLLAGKLQKINKDTYHGLH